MLTILFCPLWGRLVIFFLSIVLIGLMSSGVMLRESAQCAKSDEAAFQDVSKHQFFNTNNLWVSTSYVRHESGKTFLLNSRYRLHILWWVTIQVRLDLLKAMMDSRGGFVPLPTILNGKTVDPQTDTSTKVNMLLLV